MDKQKPGLENFFPVDKIDVDKINNVSSPVLEKTKRRSLTPEERQAYGVVFERFHKNILSACKIKMGKLGYKNFEIDQVAEEVVMTLYVELLNTNLPIDLSFSDEKIKNFFLSGLDYVIGTYGSRKSAKKRIHSGMTSTVNMTDHDPDFTEPLKYQPKIVVAKKAPESFSSTNQELITKVLAALAQSYPKSLPYIKLRIEGYTKREIINKIMPELKISKSSADRGVTKADRAFKIVLNQIKGS